MNPARISLFLLAAAFFAGCAKRPESPADAAANLPPAKVRVAFVRTEEVPTLTEITGTVRPVQRATIAAKVMGAIVELPVALGQRVKAGDLLVKISAGEISARVLQAQSQLNQAKRDLDRERDLLAKNASTADMVKGLEDRFAMTQAMVRETEVMLGYATVLAPFDGVVARRLVNAGDLATPGTPLLEVEGTDTFQVEAGIPDSLATRLAIGTPLTVEVPTDGTSFVGQLAELSSAADANAHTVPAKISIPTGTAVHSGQYARVQVPGAPISALLAPAAAVSTLGQMERVFVAGDGRAVLRLVKTGAPRGDRVEILSGLADGDRLVLNPPAGLREGQALEVQP
ncbi:MAG TPA: efflux RND transporter periplasmic adaptor subunit [Opitutaceae bacterium]|nr:efflux RND transporter periplasmic adaptor subunit [Opitutaceae bacterium]